MPEHDANHGKLGECGCGVTFEVESQPTVATDPGEGPLDDPSFRQDFEASGAGSLHDLQFPCSCALDYARYFLPDVSVTRKDAFNKRERSPGSTQKDEVSVTLVNIGVMNDDIQQETQPVDQDVPLATLDLFVRVEARSVERSPFFGGLL